METTPTEKVVSLGRTRGGVGTVGDWTDTEVEKGLREGPSRTGGDDLGHSWCRRTCGTRYGEFREVVE